MSTVNEVEFESEMFLAVLRSLQEFSVDVYRIHRRLLRP